MAEKRKILEVKHLKKYFPLKKGKFKEGDPCVKAVDDITFDLYEGETLGLVGESGCGKSVTSLSIMRLLQGPQGQIVGGEIRFNNKRLRTVDCCSQSFAFGQNSKSVPKCDTFQKVRFFGTKLNF